MKQVVLITGANGMLAKSLSKELENKYTIRFLTRKVKKYNEYLWDIERRFIDPKALNGVHHIIHLAGSSVTNKRWSKERKKNIYSSRINSSQLILHELEKNQLTIDTFISASATGYYGSTTTDKLLIEESPNGVDFLSDVCNQWENAAHSFKLKKVANRILILRIGIILSKNNGALKKIAQPIKYRIGSGIGTGNQWIPWIHILDLCRMFKFLLENNEIKGIFNAVSPMNTTNIELIRKVAKGLGRRIVLPNIPAFIIKILYGEMAIILLKGNRVSSDKIERSGFVFVYKNLEIALRNLLGKTT
jgi:uncharacterized protein (TIGR01777 family)